MFPPAWGKRTGDEEEKWDAGIKGRDIQDEEVGTGVDGDRGFNAERDHMCVCVERHTQVP